MSQTLFSCAYPAYKLTQENTQASQINAQMTEFYKQHYSDIVEIMKSLASLSINVETRAVSSSDNFTNNFQGANVGNFSNQVRDNARQQTNQYNYDSESQRLADLAEELQRLLDSLSQTYPASAMPDHHNLAIQAIQHIDSDPAFAHRILSALKAGSTSALKQLLNHPAATFLISALEDWEKNRSK
ncbi:MAG: hypothetical protein ACFE0I_25490 [Elainellaceae cyanobacterium]